MTGGRDFEGGAGAHPGSGPGPEASPAGEAASPALAGVRIEPPPDPEPSRALRVLFLEDEPRDAELVLARLRGDGFDCEVVRVETREAFAAALEGRGKFDAVLADYALPGFDGLSALALVRKRDPHLPFILISGSLGEETAVDVLVHGATDFVLKHRLGRLGPALRRALREAGERVQRRRVEEALQASEQRYRVLYDENPSMYFTLSAVGIVHSVNRFGAHQLGYEPEELAGEPIDTLHLEVDADTMLAHLERCLADPTTTHRWDIRKVRRDGTLMWVREIARAVDNPDGTRMVLSVCEDTSETHALSRELAHQATHDALTGLINRVEFERRLRRAIQTAHTDYAEHALCYLDLDQFKIINDSCGHSAGDELLRQLAGLMLQHVRQRDTLARLGGDEFGVLLEHCTVEHASRVANQIINALEDFRFGYGGRLFPVGVSIGIVSIEPATAEVSEVLAAADRACYTAKERGRSRLHVYDSSDFDLMQRRGEIRWAARLTEALESDRMRLMAQSITALGGNAAGAHCEILLRIEDDDGTLVPPGAFLPAAERYGLSGRLDRWVVDTAFEWLSADRGSGRLVDWCSINLSGQTLGDEEFLDFVLAALARTEVSPTRVCFEITETAAISNLMSARWLISALRTRGVRFALDDFGSGLSSFAYLKNLPVDFIKIDGMFIRDVCTDPVDRAMVRSITEVGRLMGKEIVAEHVEGPEVLEAVRHLGADFAQGYAVGKPQPID